MKPEPQVFFFTPKRHMHAPVIQAKTPAENPCMWRNVYLDCSCARWEITNLCWYSASLPCSAKKEKIIYCLGLVCGKHHWTLGGGGGGGRWQKTLRILCFVICVEDYNKLTNTVFNPVPPLLPPWQSDVCVDNNVACISSLMMAE